MRVWILVVLVSGCAATPTPVQDIPVEHASIDASAAGPFRHELVDWDAGTLLVEGATGYYPVQLHGEATLPEGEGPFPLAILMHGRHTTCRYLPGAVGAEFLGHPCPGARPVMEPVDSYTGYRDLSGHLASHGILSLSVSANDVNDYDNPQGLAGDDYGATARGRIVHAVIDAIAAGELDFAGHVDLERIGLMGHSRGGEGVARALLLEGAEDYGIDAVMALAPTDFARWELEDVAFATILPYCDGDVSNLQGAWMYDDMIGGPRHQFLHMGANHNFYNAVWTGDDWSSTSDAYCSPDGDSRLSAQEQSADGVLLMGSFLRHYLGVSEGLLPLLAGDQHMRGVHTSYWPANGMHMLWPDHHGDGLLAEGVEVSTCTGSTCPSVRTYSQAELKRVDWNGEARMRAPIGPDDWGKVLVMRMSVDPEKAALPDMWLAFDATDVQVPLEQAGAYVPPGDASAKTVVSDVRFQIPAGARHADLHLRGHGGMQVEHWSVREAACAADCL